MKAHWIFAVCLTLLLIVGATSGVIAQQSPSPAPAAPAAPSTQSRPDVGTPAPQSPSMQQNPVPDGRTGVTSTHGSTPWVLGAIVLIIIVAALVAMGRRREAVRRNGREPYTQPRV
jgi:hypothetical protein